MEQEACLSLIYKYIEDHNRGKKEKDGKSEFM
jgi:hypothetical protein